MKFDTVLVRSNDFTDTDMTKEKVVEITFLLMDRCCYISIDLVHEKSKSMSNLSVAMNRAVNSFSELSSRSVGVEDDLLVQCLFDNQDFGFEANATGGAEEGEGIARRLVRNKLISDSYKQIFISYNVPLGDKMTSGCNRTVDINWAPIDRDIEKTIVEYLIGSVQK